MIGNLFEQKLYNSFLNNDINKRIVLDLKTKKQKEIYKIYNLVRQQMKDGLMTNESKEANIDSIIDNKIVSIIKCTKTIDNMMKSYRNLEYIKSDISISRKMKDNIIFTYENPDLEEIVEDSPYDTNKEINEKKKLAYLRAYNIVSYEYSSTSNGYSVFDIKKDYTLETLRSELNKCLQIKYWPLVYKCINLFTQKKINLNFLKNYNREIIDVNLKVNQKKLINIQKDKRIQRDKRNYKLYGGNTQQRGQQQQQRGPQQQQRGSQQQQRGQQQQQRGPQQQQRGPQQQQRGQQQQQRGPQQQQRGPQQQQRGPQQQQQRGPQQRQRGPEQQSMLFNKRKMDRPDSSNNIQKGIEEIYKEYSKIYDLYNKDKSGNTIDAIETKIRECYRNNYLELITKEKLFFLNCNDDLENLKKRMKTEVDIKSKEKLASVLVKESPNMSMSSDILEEWVDIINNPNENIITKKMYVKDLGKYLGIDINTETRNTKITIRKKGMIKYDLIEGINFETDKDKIIDDLIKKISSNSNNNYIDDIFMLCIKYNIIDSSKLIEKIKNMGKGSQAIKIDDKDIDEKKLYKLILMLEVFDMYVKKYKLYLLRIKNTDINIRNRIFKYLISYYIQ